MKLQYFQVKRTQKMSHLILPDDQLTKPIITKIKLMFPNMTLAVC